jgi:hypothetical protein
VNLIVILALVLSTAMEVESAMTAVLAIKQVAKSVLCFIKDNLSM